MESVPFASFKGRNMRTADESIGGGGPDGGNRGCLSCHSSQQTGTCGSRAVRTRVCFENQLLQLNQFRLDVYKLMVLSWWQKLASWTPSRQPTCWSNQTINTDSYYNPGHFVYHQKRKEIKTATTFLYKTLWEWWQQGTVQSLILSYIVSSFFLLRDLMALQNLQG